MNQEKILHDLASLPPDAQQSVMNYISFLTTYHTSGNIMNNQDDISQESFIGMWKDWEDMVDSRKWVKETREREWKNSCG